jgi:MFS family permease
MASAKFLENGRDWGDSASGWAGYRVADENNNRWRAGEMAVRVRSGTGSATRRRQPTARFPEEDKAKAVGVLMCGISIGTLITAPLAAWITLALGWRVAFVLTGVLGLTVVPLWYWFHSQIWRVYGSSDPAPAFAAQASFHERSSPSMHENRRSGQTKNQQFTIYFQGRRNAMSKASIQDALRTRKFRMILGARSFADIV